jgi:hypothetical protein
MPIAVFLWGIGWSLNCIGTKREAAKPRAKPKLSVQNKIFILAPPKQKYAT